MDFEKMLEVEAAKETVERLPAETQVISRSIKPFDTRAVVANLKTMENNCNILIAEATDLVIGTDAEKFEAANLSGSLQDLTKNVKKQCEDYLEPHNKVRTIVNGVKKRIIDAATKAKNIVNLKIIQYKKQEEINQAKQQKLINEQAAQLQEKLKVQAKELNMKAPEVTPIKAPKPVSVIRGDAGASVYTRKGWKIEILDEGKIERKYCLPSKQLLNQAVKMGVRKIEGCRIYQDETPVTRTG